MKRVISLIVIIAVLLVSLSACTFKSDEELIEDRMNDFLKAYNSGDMDAVLECLDAKTRNTYKAAINIGSGLVGLTGFNVSIADLFGLGIGVMSDGDVLQLRNMKINISSDTKATVSATMYYEDYEGGYSDDVKFALVKEDGDWYICG
ncbi:MAG: hypothetical protein J6C98_06870 [Oscillospiraceae bacterium]|nr:hypothetical protein [Oscillospiraceae bacterium]